MPVLVGTRGVEGITCYLSGDYAASASNGGKTQAGSWPKCCSAAESAEQTATILILILLLLQQREAAVSDKI